MKPETHDIMLVFSKTWGAIYLLVVFLLAAARTYWPSRKSAIYCASGVAAMKRPTTKPKCKADSRVTRISSSPFVTER